MLFRNSDGIIIEIKKSDFKNDCIYYSTLMKIKTQQPSNQNKSNIKSKSKTKIETFFAIDNSESILKQESKCNFYSKQAINKLLDEF
jgi:hypothetical protein